MYIYVEMRGLYNNERGDPIPHIPLPSRPISLVEELRMFFEVPDWNIEKIASTIRRKKDKKNQTDKINKLEDEEPKVTKPKWEKNIPERMSSNNKLEDKKTSLKNGTKERADKDKKDAKKTNDGDTPIVKKQKSKITKEVAPVPLVSPTTVVDTPKPAKKSKVEAKLSGARFRFLNQKLYESNSKEALAYFKEYPEEFSHYHEGFREQTKAWPSNPVNVFIDKLRGLENSQSSKNHSIIIADMGCGDAKIAQTFQSCSRMEIKSFDLAAVNELVTIASMTSVPMTDSCADIVIFSLSLMNTDYGSALLEAFRILKPNGQLWIAEVSSRLNGSQGLDDFKKSLYEYGFNITKTDTSNSVFTVIYANKSKQKSTSSKSKDITSKAILKPCLYKKR